MLVALLIGVLALLLVRHDVARVDEGDGFADDPPNAVLSLLEDDAVNDVVPLGWVFIGVLLSVTVILFPFGRQCFNLANFTLWPFGRTAVP